MAPSDRHADQTAILVVSGGTGAAAGTWLDLLVAALLRHTPAGVFRLYVWNNDPGDPDVARAVGRVPGAVLLERGPAEALAHPHAVPLQRLFDRATADGVGTVVTMDSDAFPVRDGWLDDLLGALSSGCALAGVFRDECADDIAPYVHPCCLAVRVRTVRDLGLDFTAFPFDSGLLVDTLTSLTLAVRERGLPIHRWFRSNRNQVDPLLGGLYGDFLYHHGGTTERDARRWGLPKSEAWAAEVRAAREEAEEILFRHTGEYLGWLRGRDPPRLFVVFGAERSGVRCLVRCLEACGVPFLRSAVRTAVDRERNAGLRDLSDLAAAARAGGAPARAGLVSRARDIIDRIAAREPVGIAEPGIAPDPAFWREAAGSLFAVGSFRDPRGQAAVLEAVSPDARRRARERWTEYHRELLRVHREAGVPLFCFADGDPATFADRFLRVAVGAGLGPDPSEILRLVCGEHEGLPALRDPPPEECRVVFEALRSAAALEDGCSGEFASLLLRYQRRRALFRPPGEPPPSRLLRIARRLRGAVGRRRRGH